jgi:hypothetical protein
MTKVDMVFDQAAAVGGKQHTKNTLYESKGFQARTSVNHPNYKGEKVGNHKGIVNTSHDNDEHFQLDFNEDLMHIQNVLPISKGLEIRPSKTPTNPHIHPLTPKSGDSKENIATP